MTRIGTLPQVSAPQPGDIVTANARDLRQSVGEVHPEVCALEALLRLFSGSISNRERARFETIVGEMQPEVCALKALLRLF